MSTKAKLSAPENVHMAPDFVLSFSAVKGTEENPVKGYRVRLLDITNPESAADELFSRVITDLTFDFKNIGTAEKPVLGKYVGGKIYQNEVMAISGNNRKNTPSTRNWLVNPQGQAEEVNGSNPINPVKPAPNCTLGDTSLTIIPKQDENAYDICVISTTGVDAAAGETLGSCRVVVMSPVGSPQVISNFLGKISWITPPTPGTHKFGVSVNAVDDVGNVSHPCLLGPKDFTIAAKETVKETAPADTAASKETTKAGVETPPDTKWVEVVTNKETTPTDTAESVPAPSLSDSEKVEVNKMPARLNKVRRDLEALPQDRKAAWATLHHMLDGLADMARTLGGLQEKFGNTPDAHIQDLTAEVKALTEKVENVRALRSDEWNRVLQPRLRKIAQLIEEIGYGEGEPGEKAYDELEKMKAIIGNTTSLMNMVDVSGLIIASKRLLAEVEAIKRQVASPKAQERTDESPVTQTPEHKPEPNQPRKEPAQERPKTAESEELKALTAAIAAAREDIAKAKAEAEELRKKQGEDADKKRKDDEEKKQKEEEAKKQKEDTKKDQPKGWFNWASPLWSQLRKRWILWLLTALILGLITWLLWDSEKNKGLSGPSKPDIGVQRPVDKTDAVGNKVQQTTSTGVGSLPSAMMTSANEAREIEIRTKLKVEGTNNLNNSFIGNGQVLINNTSNVFIYNGLGASRPASDRVEGSRIPESLGRQPESDGCIRWSKIVQRGETLGYALDRTKWSLRSVSAAMAEGDLRTEIKGLDGQWHEVVPGSTNSFALTEYRFSVAQNATAEVKIDFILRPKH